MSVSATVERALPSRLALNQQFLSLRHGEIADPWAQESEREMERAERPPVVKCILAGLIVALLYGWPTEFLIYIFTRGFPMSVFYGSLLGLAAVASVVIFALSAYELEYWKRNQHKLPDYVTESLGVDSRV